MRQFERILFLLSFLCICSCTVVPKKQTYSFVKKVTENRVINPSYLAEKASYHYLLAELWALKEEQEKSLDQIKNAQMYDSVSLNLKAREVEFLLEKGDLYQGLEQLDALLVVYKKSPLLLELKGKIYEALKSYKASEKIYHQLPDSDRVLLAQIRLAFLQNHFKRAIFLAKKAHFKGGAFLLEAQYYLAKSFEEKKDFIRAQRVYKNSLNAQVSVESFLLFALADLYHNQNKIQKEVQLLQKYKNRIEEPSLAFQRLFGIYVEKEDYINALVQAEALLDLGVKDVGFQFQVSLLFIESKQYKKAAIVLEQILLTDSSLDRIQFYLGLTYQQLGEVQKAKNIFSSMPTESPYYLEAIKASYYLFAQEQSWLQAEALLKKVVKSEQTPLSAKKELGYLLVLHYEGRKAIAKAVAYAEQMIQSFPDYVDALNYVAYKWVITNVNLPKAKILITKAHKLEPNNPFVMDTLGWLFFKQKNYKQARNYLELAYKQDKSLEISEHLGDLYRHFKELIKANKLYTQAFSLAELPADKARLKNKISLISLARSKKGKRLSNTKKLEVKSRQPSSIIGK